MGQRVREYNWSQTSLGTPDTWPQSLLITLNLILHSRFPMFLFWGPELLCFYNDAYRPSLGADGKHPYALGKPGSEVWPEIWDTIKPLIDQALTTGEASWNEDQLIPIYRNGKLEDVYWTFSYSPVYDEYGNAAGVFVACTETTEKVKNLKQLEESKKQLEFALEAAELGTWDLDLQTYTFTANAQLRQWIGIPLEDEGPFPLDPHLQAIAPTDIPYVLDFIHSVGKFDPGHTHELECTLIDPHTHVDRIVKVKGKAWFDANQAAYRFNGTVQDITTQVKTRRKIEESELYFRRMADTVPITLWTTDAQGNCTYLNAWWSWVTGQSLEESLGLGWVKMVHPDDQENTKNIFLQANARQVPFQLLYRRRTKEGDYRWVLDKGEPRFNENDEFEGYIGILVDVHEQKLAEETLRQSEKRFQGAVAAVQGILWTNNAQGQMEGEQLGWEALTGQTYEEYQGYGWAKVVHPDDVQPALDTWKEAVAERKPYIFEHRLRMKNGQWGNFAIRAIPSLNPDQTIREWVGVHTNITEQRQAEKALRESEETFRSFADNLYNLAWMATNEGWVYWYNQRWYEYTGTALEQVQGWDWQKVLHPEHAERVIEHLKEAWLRDGPWELTFPLRGQDGQYRWFLTRAVPVKNQEGQIYRWVGTNTDVHEQKLSEEAIKVSENRFRTLAETLPQMVWVMDGEGHIEYASGKWEEYSGFEYTADSWLRIVHPQDKDMSLAYWQICRASGQSFRTELRMRDKNGEYRWHSSSAEPVKDSSGKIAKWIGAIHDIHDQKTLSEQLEKLVTERTRELQRSNEDLQQFAHVASHDLKEPVRKIRLFSNFLANSFSDTLPNEGLLYLSKIQDAASRMYAMIDGVLHYSSLNTSGQVIESVNLNQLLQHIESDLELPIKQKNASITYTSMPTIEGYSVLLYQLFYNLINNSLKFSKADVSPVITLTFEEITAPPLTQSVSDTWIRLQLSDNGIGFRPVDAQKIFKTFVRLNSKDQYEGTGLGLALCHRIVERHGGSIAATGEEGVGAIFTIELPVRQQIP